MELRTVNTFLHIAELHSFSRTARQLGYSQSAVSSQIAQLEAELGAPLFDRVGKTVRLTDAGQTFLGYARTLLETAQQAQAALQPAQQVRGSLRIALADSVCSTFLPGLLQRYHARCPQVELVLCTGELSRSICEGARSAGGTALWFPDKDALISALPETIRMGDCILVKASHSMAFEDVTKALLELPQPPTCIIFPDDFSALGGYNAISAILRGYGDSVRPMVFVGIACVINIILDFVFVKYFGLGVRGTAIATVASQAFSMAASI